MHPTMDIKGFIREVYNARNIMTRSCYLSERGEVRTTDAVQMCPSHRVTIQEKGKNNFLHSLNINCYVIALKICQVFLFLLLGLYLNQGSGDDAPKKCVCMQIYMQDTCSMYL